MTTSNMGQRQSSDADALSGAEHHRQWTETVLKSPQMRTLFALPAVHFAVAARSAGLGDM